MNIKALCIILAGVFLLGNFNSCRPKTPRILAEGVVYPVTENFVTTIDGRQTGLFTLENKHGLRVDITNFGGRIVSLLVPDNNGVFDDIVTGYHTIEEFLQSEEVYFGALIGRYANRIGNASFEIDGVIYNLPANNGPNHLHGGPKGFHMVVWDAVQEGKQKLRLSYHSPHLEEGYPGNLSVEVVYELTDDNELIITYHATTDQKTHVNLTNHAFFNLAGEGNRSIYDHYLKINANYITPIDEGLIPTGEFSPVSETAFDFREFRRIGERINASDIQLLYGKGYDHNFVLNRISLSDSLEFAAAVYEPVSGRKMEIFTTKPGLQFYSGNFLTGREVGKRGEPYEFRTSFCLETQFFPDSPNKPHFPSTLLEPGEVYHFKTIHRFSVFE
ncbi:MAG TPA: aldose epimerase family protein [Bacteroidales bacterium]|nr:aldose epimerase family protein [Bacteroidales bacterium]